MHRIGGLSAVAGRVRRVDLDELLEQLALEGPVRIALCGECDRSESDERESGPHGLGTPRGSKASLTPSS